MFFIAMFIASVAISLAVAMLMPKPKQAKVEAQDLQAPTVSAGRPVPVPFGTVTIKSPNVLWFGDKRVDEYEVDA